MICCTVESTYAQTACPANFDSDSLHLAATHPDQWHGKMIAFNALVVRKEHAFGKRAYLRVQLIGGDTMWMQSNRAPEDVQTGDIERVMGFFGQLDAQDSSLRVFNRDGFHVITLAEFNQSTSQLFSIPGTELQVKEWLDGKVPEAFKE